MIAIDDLNDWVGFLNGHPGVRTPAMDALAATSTVFRHAYCTSPSCSPSRASVLSGLQVHETGVYDNLATFGSVNPGKATLLDMMRSGDYDVASFGKIDHVFNGVPQPMPMPTPFPYTNKDCAVPNLGEGAFDWAALDVPDEAMPDHVYASRAIEFMQAERDRPFFLAVGFERTHTAWYVPRRFVDMYPLEDIAVPPQPADDLDDLGDAARYLALYHAYTVPGARIGYDACIKNQGLQAQAVQAYLASISWVDAQVQRVIDALEASGQADNTLVVLWSDHGFHLGEKFHWLKLALWEPTTRVPLLVRAPGQTSMRDVSSVVSLIDVAPTILDYTDVPAAYPMTGRSLRPLVEHPETAWNHPALMTMRTSATEVDHAVRSGEWRYIRYYNGERELYAITRDPDEYTNLSGNARYDEVMARLDALMPPLDP